MFDYFLKEFLGQLLIFRSAAPFESVWYGEHLVCFNPLFFLKMTQILLKQIVDHCMKLVVQMFHRKRINLLKVQW